MIEDLQQPEKYGEDEGRDSGAIKVMPKITVHNSLTESVEAPKEEASKDNADEVRGQRSQGVEMVEKQEEPEALAPQEENQEETFGCTVPVNWFRLAQEDSSESEDDDAYVSNNPKKNKPPSSTAI